MGPGDDLWEPTGHCDLKSSFNFRCGADLTEVLSSCAI